jgi:hypothetical protein
MTPLMKRVSVLVACVAALLGTVVYTAHAASTRCGTATEKVDQAQVAYDTALKAAEARAREVGFTEAEIAQAKAALADGKVEAAEQTSLYKLYEARPAQQKADLMADLPKLKAVFDTRLALNAAIAARNVECSSKTGANLPSKAPAAGDGSSLS